MQDPDYQEYSSDQMPYAHPSEDVVIKIISGTAQGNEQVSYRASVCLTKRAQLADMRTSFPYYRRVKSPRPSNPTCV